MGLKTPPHVARTGGRENGRLAGGRTDGQVDVRVDWRADRRKGAEGGKGEGSTGMGEEEQGFQHFSLCFA